MGGDIAYRYWLEFADMSKMPRNASEPNNAYDPKIDYTKATDKLGRPPSGRF